MNFPVLLTSNIDNVNEGIKSLPELIKGGFYDSLKALFSQIYNLAYWGTAFYSQYEICCGVCTDEKKYTGKVTIAIITYVFLTIIAGVIL